MKKSTIIKRTALIMAFVLQFSALLWVGGHILKLKRYDGALPFQGFYAQKENTCDVLFLGSSNVGINLDMSTFWMEHGISGYCLWGAIQPFWGTYYYLLEALKTQTPKVVVMDVFGAQYKEEYSSDSIQQTNLVGMRLSKNKLDAIRVSAPRENWLNLILEYPLYHSRITELTMHDFTNLPWSPYKENYKGTEYRYEVNQSPIISAEGITEIEPIHKKSEQYLRKIIETCEDLGIPFVLIKTPTLDRASEQPRYNHIAAIAQEYGIPFLNMNFLDDETGIVETDYIKDGHMNTMGARKASSWLGKYLKEHYDIPDHRGDPAYMSWNNHAGSINLTYFRAITERKYWVEELIHRGDTLILVQNAPLDDSEAGAAMVADMARLGISLETETAGCWLIPNTAGEEVIVQEFRDGICTFDFEGIPFTMDFADSGLWVNDSYIVDGKDPGFYAIVYDRGSQEVLNCYSLSQNNGYEIQRLAY